MLAARSQSHSSGLLEPIIIICLTNSFAADIFHCLVPMVLAKEHTKKRPGPRCRHQSKGGIIIDYNYRKKNTHLLAHGGKKGVEMAAEMQRS